MCVEENLVLLTNILEIFCLKRKSTNSKIWKYLYNLRMCFYILTVMLCGLYRQTIDTIYESDGVVTKAIQFVQYNCGILMVFVCLLWTNFRSSHMQKFIKTSDEIDKKLKRLGHNIDYRVIRKFCNRHIIWILIKIVLQNVWVININNLNLKYVLDYLLFTLPLVFVYAMVFQWCSYINMLQTHFRAVQRLCSKKNKFIVESGIIMDKLYDQAIILNKGFSLQISCIVPSFFVLILYSSFRICQMLTDKYLFNSITVILNFLYVTTFFEMVIPCLMIRGDCENVMETLKELAVQENGRINVRSALLYFEYSLLYFQVNTVILQMHHEKIEFSVFGIFLLDGTLVCSVRIIRTI